jgi:hypothetical protein
MYTLLYSILYQEPGAASRKKALSGFRAMMYTWNTIIITFINIYLFGYLNYVIVQPVRHPPSLPSTLHHSPARLGLLQLAAALIMSQSPAPSSLIGLAAARFSDSITQRSHSCFLLRRK